MQPYQYQNGQAYYPIPNFMNNNPNNNNNNQNNNAPEIFMELDKKQCAQVVKIIGSKEQVLFAGIVDKINQSNVSQRRILVITTKFLYNIDPDVSLIESFALCGNPEGYKLRRKIDIKKIFALTVSSHPATKMKQFVIHVKDEYDYVYKGDDKREQIVKSIVNAHFANSSEPIIFFCRDEADLSKYRVTDDDKKDSKRRRPRDGNIFVTQELMSKGLEWIIDNRKNLIAPPPINDTNNTNDNNNSPQQGYPTGPYNGAGPQYPPQCPYPHQPVPSQQQNVPMNNQAPFNQYPQSAYPNTQYPYPQYNQVPQPYQQVNNGNHHHAQNNQHQNKFQQELAPMPSKPSNQQTQINTNFGSPSPRNVPYNNQYNPNYPPQNQYQGRPYGGNY